VALVEATPDGHLDDTYPAEPRDKLLVGFDRDGTFRRWNEQIPLPALTRIGGVTCSVYLIQFNVQFGPSPGRTT